jgi:hypothetical protein
MIVGPDGKPTEYFIRWAQQRQIDIGQAIDEDRALEIIQAFIDDYALQAGSGISITPDGKLTSNPTISAEVQAILNQISSTHGAVLFRGATNWQALAPGTAGQVLATNGAGADPSWVNQSGGGGLIIDMGASDASYVTSGGAQASKANIIKPRRDMSVISLYARMFSKVNGATYTGIIATLSTPTGYTIGTVLGTTTTFTATDTSQEWIELTFSSPISLTAGTRYALIITRSGVSGTTVLTISTFASNGDVSYTTLVSDTGLSDCGYAAYTAANPPVAGTAAAISGSPGAYGIGVKYT